MTKPQDEKWNEVIQNTPRMNEKEMTMRIKWWNNDKYHTNLMPFSPCQKTKTTKKIKMTKVKYITWRSIFLRPLGNKSINGQWAGNSIRELRAKIAQY